VLLDAEVDGGARAIKADRVHVGGAVSFINFDARGLIRMIGASIGGSLDLVGGRLESAGAGALDIREATIGGTLHLAKSREGRRLTVRGHIDLGRARIGGQLLMRNVTLESAEPAVRWPLFPAPAGTVLSAPRVFVGGEVLIAESCAIGGRVDMSMGDLSGVLISGPCVLSAPGQSVLDMTNCELRGDLKIDHEVTIEGTVRLAGAVIHGMLLIQASMSGAERRSLVGATALAVDGDVDLSGARADGGRINFRGATLGSLNAEGARLHNPGGYTVSLNQAVVKGSVRLVDGFASTGLVVLNRTTIEGRLQLGGGSFSCPGPAPLNEHGNAIEAISATVRGGIDLGWVAVSPSVDFTDATTTFLADDPASWPERFTIAGLRYDRFAGPRDGQPGRVWDPAARCAWLRRQAEFDAGSYEQAARVFRQHGYADEAEQILMAQRRHARQVGRSNSSWPQRAVDVAYSLIGYGYRPGRVLYLLASLLVVVAVSLELPAVQATLRATNGNGAVYSTSGLLTTSTSYGPPAEARVRAAAHVDSCGDGQVRCFSPVLYAIDTVIPLISLDQRSTWYPDPHVADGYLVMWWLNLATMLGWLLSSIFVLSLAKLSRSS
jgi:hypothetical protein